MWPSDNASAPDATANTPQTPLVARSATLREAMMLSGPHDSAMCRRTAPMG
jgi:hypothetical protein